MRKSGKSMLFFDGKISIFISRGTLSKLIAFDFLYFFIEEKNFATILKNIYFLRVFFNFFTPFSFDFFDAIDFGANKRGFKHCKPPVMVSLASSTSIVPILILK